MDEKRLEEKKKNFIAALVITLVMFLIKFWSVFLVKVPWISDEIGVWQTSEYFTGHGESWKSYIIFSGRKNGFYGVLPSIIYLPVIMVSKNPVVVYRLCLILNIIMLIFAAYLVYKIMHKILELEWKKSILFALSSVALYSVLFNANVIMTETIFTVWVWLVVYVVFIGIKKNDANIRDTFCLSFLLALGYLIHSRCLIVYGMVFIIIFLNKVLYSKWLIRPLYFGVIFIGMILLFSQITSNIQQYFWDADNVVNSTEYTASKVFLISDVLLHNMQAVLKTFLSLLAAFTIETGGILICCVYISVIYIRQILHYFKEQDRKIEVLLFIFMAGCFWGMNFCIAIMSYSPSRSKWYVYTRYATPFLGEYILICLYLLYKLKYSCRKMVLFHVIFLPMLVKWIAVNWPVLLADAKMGLFDSAFFFCYKLMAVINEYGINVWLKIISLLVVLNLVVFLIFLYHKKMGSVVCITVFSVLLYIIANLSYVTPGEFSVRYWDKVDKIAECIEKYPLDEYDIKYMGTDSFYLPTQLVLSKYDAICVEKFEEIKSENVIFFSDLLINRDISEFIFELDTEEYLYTSNQNLCAVLGDEYKRIK